jgi:16S rRNA (uracil1498-N3)-methyltransferase
MPSYHFPGLGSFEAGDVIVLEGEEFHHLVHVAHQRQGDRVRLNSGQGWLGEGELFELSKRSAKVRLIQASPREAPSAPFAIAFSLLKNNHDNLIVEKCTELGVSLLFPFVSSHSVRRPSANTRLRFGKVALAAIKQCDNPWLPEVAEPAALPGVLGLAREMGFTPILCSERLPQRWLHHLELKGTDRPCFFIGPEGGWSEADLQVLEGIREISTSGLITRAETAAIGIAAQWQAYANQLRTRGTT